MSLGIAVVIENDGNICHLVHGILEQTVVLDRGGLFGQMRGHE